MDGTIGPEEGSGWSAIIFAAIPKLDLYLLEGGLKTFSQVNRVPESM